MVVFRKIAALTVMLALVNYGAAAAAVHAHEYAGFHDVHIIVDHGHDEGADHHAPAAPLTPIDADGAPASPTHNETGFHSHGSTQFGPVDVGFALRFVGPSQLAELLDLSGLIALDRSSPPFKPPRAIL